MPEQYTSLSCSKSQKSGGELLLLLLLLLFTRSCCQMSYFMMTLANIRKRCTRRRGWNPTAIVQSNASLITKKVNVDHRRLSLM